MKEIIKIGNLSFAQQSAVNCGLKLNHLLIVSYINDFIASGNCEIEVANGEKYYYIAYQKLVADLPIFDIGKKQIIRLISELVAKNVLTPLNRTVGRKKTYYKLNLNLIQHTKFIEPVKRLSVVDSSATSPELKFYQDWYVEKFKEFTNKIDAAKFYPNEIECVTTRFRNLINKICLKPLHLILGQQIATTHILSVYQDFFKNRTAEETLNLINGCYQGIDSKSDIKNKFGYTVSVFYNIAIDAPGYKEVKQKISNFKQRSYTKKELEGLFQSIDDIEL